MSERRDRTPERMSPSEVLRHVREMAIEIAHQADLASEMLSSATLEDINVEVNGTVEPFRPTHHRGLQLTNTAEQLRKLVLRLASQGIKIPPRDKKVIWRRLR